MTAPKYRFPEFWDTEEWKEKKLIDVTDKKVKWSFIGGPFGSNLKSSDYVVDGIRIIQLQNIGDAEFINDYKIFTSEEKADELLSNNIYPGDIILSKMGDPVGRACLIPDDHKRYVMCSDGIRLVVDENSNSKYFIYSLINSIQFRSLVEKTATGSTRKRIGLDELKNLPMLLPTLPEQQKIADCLSSIDDRITAETQKLSTLKVHKKGLMQQLFPAEGETVPDRRFPEFQDTEEWIKTSLGSLTLLITSGSRDWAKFYSDTGSKFIRMTNLPKSGIQLILDDLKFISLPSSNFEGARTSLQYQDILISITAELGKIGIIPDNFGQAYINQHTALVRIDKNHSCPIYLAHYLSTEISNKRLNGLNDSGAKAGLNLNTIRAFKVASPTVLEQKKIADCLSSLDELITAQTQKIDTLKIHKKGLMQQLFPAVENAIE